MLAGRPYFMPRRTGVFLKEFVVLFGFLNGVWFAVGVNPGAELLEVLLGMGEGLVSGSLLEFAATFVPLVLLGVMLFLIHRKGGWLGFAAVGLAFLAGLQVTSAPRVMAVLLLAALALGYWAARR